VPAGSRTELANHIRVVVPAQSMVQLEVEITETARIRSRINWPESSGPWIEGEIEELLVHFAYAGWTAYKTGCAVSLMLSSCDEEIGLAISEMLSKTIRAMGAVEVSEVRMNRDALDALRKDRIEP